VLSYRWWDIYYFRFLSAALKCTNMVSTLSYTPVLRIKFKSITSVNIKCVFHKLTHVCGGEIRFSDFKKFTLYTCSGKPEVDIMMPSVVSDTPVIQWQCHKKQLVKRPLYLISIFYVLVLCHSGFVLLVTCGRLICIYWPALWSYFDAPTLCILV